MVALISLVVAVSGLSYNTWRNERTEHNRNIRQAAFQQLVYHAHYDRDATTGNPRTGWAYVETIQDFGTAMPAPVRMRDRALLEAWRKHFDGLGTNDNDAEAITSALDAIQSSHRSSRSESRE